MNSAPRIGLTALATALALATAQPATAGPPFITDDPEPTDLRKWEIYDYVSGSHDGGITSADFGLDLNYGAARGVQLTAVLPMHAETGAPIAVGDLQLAIKYKFVTQGNHGAPLDVTVFPRVILPTGRGSRHAQLLLPVWLQHDLGKWQVFGGGGYMLHSGAGNRDYWVQGVAILRQMRPGWQLGVEQFHQGPTKLGERPVTGLNLGTLVHLSGPVSLIGSAGQGLNRRQTVFYAAIKLDL